MKLYEKMLRRVNEMLAILSDRDCIMQKKELESANAKWNEYLNERYYTSSEWSEEM